MHIRYYVLTSIKLFFLICIAVPPARTELSITNTPVPDVPSPVQMSCNVTVRQPMQFQPSHLYDGTYEPTNLFNNPAACAQWSPDDYARAALYCFGRQQGDQVFIENADLLRIMQQWPLYNNPAFWMFVKDIPAFSAYMPHLYNVVQQNPAIQQQLGPKARELFERAHANLQHFEYKRQKMNVLHHDLVYEQEHNELCDNERIKRRLRALHNPDIVGYDVGKSFALVSAAEKLLKKNGQNVDDYTQCTGNPIQHVIHAEFVEIINEVAQSKQPLESAPLILRCAKTGVAENKKGNVAEAASWSDYANNLLKFSKKFATSIAKGVFHGTKNAATTVLDPVGTFCEAGKGLCSIAISALRVYGHFVQIERAVNNGDYKEAEELAAEVDRYTAKLLEQYKKIPWEQNVEMATAFVVEWFATKKFTSLTWEKMLGELAPARQVATAEGVVETVRTEEQFIQQAASETPHEQKPPSQPKQNGTPSSKRTEVTHIYSEPEITQALIDSHTVDEIPAVIGEGMQLIEYDEQFIRHFYEQQQVKIISASGKLKRVEVKGGHHDFNRIMQNEGKLVLVNETREANGVVAGKVLCENVEFTKTLFPPELSKCEVFEIIKKGAKNPLEKARLLENGRFGRIGFAEGFYIEYIFEYHGKSFVTSIPLKLDDPKLLNILRKK